jgi:transcriptional regulator with XRE-family HTH domain
MTVSALRLRDLVAAEVRAWMARQQATGEALAVAMGTSPNSVSRRLRGKTSFDVDELDQVAIFLGVSLEQLLAPALAERDRRASTDTVTESATSPAVLITQGRRGPNAEKSS